MYFLLILLTFIYVPFFLVNSRVNRGDRKKIFYIIFFTTCALILGLRAETVGVDTSSYKSLYYLFKTQNWSEIHNNISFTGTEIVYAYIMKIFSSLGASYYVFQLIEAGLFCFLIGKVYANYCVHPFFGAIMFLGTEMYLFSFNITRQMIAVGLILNAYIYLEKRILKSVLLLIIAMCFHFTSIIFVLMFILYRFRKHKIVIKLVPVMLLLIIINYQTIMHLLSRYLTKYATYFRNAREIQSGEYVYLLWAAVAVCAIYSMVNRELGYEQKIYSIFSLLYVAANVVGLNFNYAERMGCYFLPFIAFNYENVGESIKTEAMRKIFYVLVSAVYIAYFLLSVSAKQYSYQVFFA